MKHVRLIAAVDEYDNKPGLMLKGIRMFDGFAVDRDGLSIAHDIIEHQNGLEHMGPVWDELEALGAIWYTRGRWGDMMTGSGSFYTPEQNIASDVTRMFREWDGHYGPRGLSIGRRAHNEDETFNYICEMARNDIPKEDDEADLSRLDDYLAMSLRRMRSGYRKAEKRFERGGASRFNAPNLFAAIKEAVKDAHRELEYEGQEFRLSYGNCEARCTAIYDDEAY